MVYVVWCGGVCVRWFDGTLVCYLCSFASYCMLTTVHLQLCVIDCLIDGHLIYRCIYIYIYIHLHIHIHIGLVLGSVTLTTSKHGGQRSRTRRGPTTWQLQGGCR